MNEADNWETRTGRVADRGPATIGVPPKDLAGKAEAAHGVPARGQLHTARWQMEDICPARRIEHVWPIEKARKRLTVLAVADKAKPGIRRDFFRHAAHMAAPATEREILRVLSQEKELVI